MAVTNLSDVESRWVSGGFNFPDDTVEQLIEDAEDEIKVFLQVKTDEELLSAVPRNRVVRVASRMVSRALRNPGGYRSISEGTGPYSASRMFGGDNPGEIELTESEKSALLGRRDVGRAFTVFPYV